MTSPVLPEKPLQGESSSRSLRRGLCLWLLACIAFFSIGAHAQTHTVGGSVAGLTGGGLLLTMTFSAPACVADDKTITLHSTDTNDCFLPSTVNQCCSKSIKATSSDGISTVVCTCGPAIIPLLRQLSGIANTTSTTQTVTIAANASTYQFPTALASGTTYSIVVTTQPVNPLQSCSLFNSSGVVASANITNVSISCGNALTSGFRDLTLDTLFDSGTYDYVDITSTGHTNDRGVAVVQSDTGGYWLIGSTIASDNVHATPVVTPVSSSGIPGAPVFYPGNTSLSSLNNIVGAVKGVNNTVTHIYVIGNYQINASADLDFGVVCLSAANAFLACPGFGSGGLSHFAFDRGGNNNDVPNSIAYDDTTGDIFITGPIDVGGYDAIGVVRMNGSTGAVVSSWGNAATPDGSFVYSANYVANGTTYPLGIAVGSPRASAHDVFVVGYAYANSTGSDTDGVILAIEANNGKTTDSGWNSGFANRVFFDLGATEKIDVLSAVALRHNGNLLVAGYSDGDSGLSRAIVGEYDGQGVARSSFCGSKGVCNQIFGLQPAPTAIAERPGLGNFVVSTDNVSSTGVGIQSVYQLDQYANSVTAFGETGYPSSGTTMPISRAAGIMVDDTNKVLQAGERRWNPATNDFDMTIRRWFPADSIFANGMGGAFAD